MPTAIAEEEPTAAVTDNSTTASEDSPGLAAKDPSVVNISLFNKELRAVDYLFNAGLLKHDTDRFDLSMAKLINHAAYAHHDESYKNNEGRSIAQLQDDFQKDHDIKKLIDGYLTARANHAQHVVDGYDALPFTDDSAAFIRRRERAEARRDKYKRDVETYRNNPSMIEGIVSKYPQILSVGKYLPIGRLAVEMNMIEGDRAKVQDMVDDVLANATAHSFRVAAQEIMSTSDDNLKRYRDFPQQYANNITAKAYDAAIHTTPLESLQIFSEGAPPVLQLQALNSLMSAQLNAMSVRARKTPPSEEDIEYLANALPEMKQMVRFYQQAAMSLSYHFLTEGPGSEDPHDMRMRTLAAHLKDMMEADGMGSPMSREEAKKLASSLAQGSAKYLLQFAQENMESRHKLDALLKQIDPELSLPTSRPDTAIIEPSWASELKPVGSYADQAKKYLNAAKGVGV